MKPATMARPAPRRLLLAALAALALACRFQPEGGHWIEAHSQGQATHLAACPAGVMAVGTSRHLHLYPTDWARPWRDQGAQEVNTVAASSAAFYVLTPAGEAVRIVNGQWSPYAGSVAWGATALAASPDDHLFVVVGGHLRRVDNGELREAPCGDVAAVAASAPSGEEIYVLDGAGALFRGVPGACAPVATPMPLRDVAAFPGRIVIVTKDGVVWRRRGDEPWRRLAPVRKYRPGRTPYDVEPVQVSLSASTTWLLDAENSVFLLSDELGAP